MVRKSPNADLAGICPRPMPDFRLSVSVGLVHRKSSVECKRITAASKLSCSFCLPVIFDDTYRIEKEMFVHSGVSMEEVSYMTSYPADSTEIGLLREKGRWIL